jgi:hypothetical protein
VAKEYIKYLTGAAAMIAVGKMAMDDDDKKFETDTRSSQAGKIRIGKNTWVDTYGGLQQTVVFLSRAITRETKDAGGVWSLVKNVPQNRSDYGDVFTRFVRSKLAPVPGVIANISSGKTYSGKDVNKEIKNTEILGFGNVYSKMINQSMSKDQAMGVARGAYIIKELVTPMNISTIYDAFRQEGASDAAFIAVLSTLGEGVQTYEEKPRLPDSIQAILGDVTREQMQQSSATNDAISRFVQSGKMDGEELLKSLKEENVDLTDPLEPQRIKMKLKAALIRGEADPFMNALIDAGTEKRIVILKEAKKFMADDEYLSYLKQARAFGLIPK